MSYRVPACQELSVTPKTTRHGVLYTLLPCCASVAWLAHKAQRAHVAVFGGGGSFPEAKKRRAATVVRGGEVILGSISGKKLWCNPSILECDLQKHNGIGYNSRSLERSIHSSVFMNTSGSM